MKDNVKRLYGDLPAVVDMLEGKINAKTSIPLAELILEMIIGSKLGEGSMLLLVVNLLS